MMDHKYAVLVTTSPRKKSTLNRTISSLRAAGLSSSRTVISADRDVELDKKSFSALTRIHWHGDPHGSWPNFLCGSNHMLMLPRWDAMVYVQDDVILASNLRSWLDQNLWPDPPGKVGVASLYTSGPNARDGYAGWWKPHPSELPRVASRGACALVMPRLSVERLLRDPPGRGSSTKTDHWLGLFCKQEKLGYWLHEPSLAQHIGEKSAINPWRAGDWYWRSAKRWRTNALRPETLKIETAEPPA